MEAKIEALTARVNALEATVRVLARIEAEKVRDQKLTAKELAAGPWDRESVVDLMGGVLRVTFSSVPQEEVAKAVAAGTPRVMLRAILPGLRAGGVEDLGAFEMCLEKSEGLNISWDELGFSPDGKIR